MHTSSPTNASDQHSKVYRKCGNECATCDLGVALTVKLDFLNQVQVFCLDIELFMKALLSLHINLQTLCDLQVRTEFVRWHNTVHQLLCSLEARCGLQSSAVKNGLEATPRGTGMLLA